LTLTASLPLSGCGASPTAAATRAASDTTAANACRLTFVPDAGLRRDNASNARANMDSSGTVFLYYQDRTAGAGGRRLATSSDGLTFGASVTPAPGNFANSRDRIRLADGTWRVFQLSPTYQLTMLQSADGVTFTNVNGVRYAPAPADNGTMGVYDVYRDKSGAGLTLLYLGDLFGANNTRRATSSDGGTSFTYRNRNVLGDDGAGGGGRSYVDISSIVLADGRRCLYAMQGGLAIYSFVSADWTGFTLEPGARVSRGDWTSLQVQGLFDPTVIRLSDGRFRMYVTGQIDATRQAVLSATTR
jgi:hypothetical protein